MGWNHIILEGFCCRKLSDKKDKYIYQMKSGEKLKKVPNPNYDSQYKIPKKPKFCRDRVGQICYFESCPHLGTGDLPKDDYQKIMKFINTLYKDKD